MKDPASKEVATHVLVPVSTAEKLRHLSRKTRVTQSEYLREAVQDLLQKYGISEQEVIDALKERDGDA